MWTQPCQVRWPWGEMVEWDSGGDSNRLLLLREIREREKSKSYGKKVYYTSSSFRRGGYLFYILMRPNLGLKHTLCVAENITFDTSPT